MLAVSTDTLRKQEQICSCWDIKTKGCPLSSDGMFSNKKAVIKAPKAATTNRLDLGEIHKSMKGLKKKKKENEQKSMQVVLQRSRPHCWKSAHPQHTFVLLTPNTNPASIAATVTHRKSSEHCKHTCSER